MYTQWARGAAGPGPAACRPGTRPSPRPPKEIRGKVLKRNTGKPKNNIKKTSYCSITSAGAPGAAAAR